jgi:hypothetical protein
MYTEDQRSVILLAVLFGVAFGTLVLFGTNYFALGMMLLIITATVFAADRQDLKILAATKLMLVFIVAVAIMTVLGSLTIADYVGSSLFFVLSTACIFLLIGYYIILRSVKSRRDLEYV